MNDSRYGFGVSYHNVRQGKVVITDLYILMDTGTVTVISELQLYIIS